ncbi:MAG: bifunctional sugar-1-phosphate nucleotidylyltransferase/acetyltransferase [Euryarchaeota archaeon]|nr:bifunctional sugar-1-phosphate nucleotidylyltransferase/acetyltransferase [Euryarchaeota archaeon]
MKAVILAAGEGMRCRPLTLTRSKVMLRIANKPMIEYVVQSLAESGITDILMVVGYAKERIMNYFGNGKDFGVNIEYTEQKHQLGTAHAIKQAKHSVGDEFLVLNGDNLVSADTIADITKRHTGGTSILTTIRKATSGYALVIESGGVVKKIVEGQILNNAHNINTGIYIFDQTIFDAIEETLQADISGVSEFGITDSIQRMINAGYDVHAHRTDHTWTDVINSWDLLGVNAMILEGMPDSVNGLADRKINDRVVVGKDSTIGENSYVKGPVIIGKNCDIGPNVVIAPSTSIGDNVTIEPFTYIKNSVIFDDVHIGSHSTIKNTVIGENNVIDSHFVVESRRDLTVELERKLYHADELGTVIGDAGNIGCDVAVTAGALIGIECRIEAGTVVRKQIPSHALVV